MTDYVDFLRRKGILFNRMLKIEIPMVFADTFL